MRMTGCPIVEPPFYAARQCPWFLNTDGGPASVTSSADPSIMNQIPSLNLYSAGEFGSIWSDMAITAAETAVNALHSAVLAPETAWVSLRRP